MSGKDDVMDKLDDVLDKLNDNKEKIEEVEAKVDALAGDKYVYTYCDSCNGNGVVEDTGTNPETGQPNPPATCKQCNGKGKIDSAIVKNAEIADAEKMSLSGSIFKED